MSLLINSRSSIDKVYTIPRNTDFTKVCRTCLRKTTDQIDITNQYLHKMLESSSGLVITGEDNLPQQICDQCVNSIKLAYIFRQECQRVDALLREYLNKQAVNASTELLIVVESDEEDVELFEKYQIQDKDFIYQISSNKDEDPIVPDELSGREYEEPFDQNQCILVEDDSNDEIDELTSQEQAGDSIAQIFCCIVCNHDTELFSDLVNHYILNHATGDAPFKCYYCNQVLLSTDILRVHLGTHYHRFKRPSSESSSKTPYSCIHCSQAFTKFSYLKEHLDTHHRRKTYTCGQCRKEFTSSYGFKIHCNSHRQIKELQCQRCGRQFSTRSYLLKHGMKKCFTKPLFNLNSLCRSDN